jgi:hypothetical protein
MTVRTTSQEPNGEATLAPKTGAGDTPGFQALTLDVELYQGFIDDPEMSDADKRKLIETLWSIMVSFVDLGFGIHPLQQAQEGNGSVGEPGDEIEGPLAITGRHLLSSDPDTPKNPKSKTMAHSTDDRMATRES